MTEPGEKAGAVDESQRREPEKNEAIEAKRTKKIVTLSTTSAATV